MLFTSIERDFRAMRKFIEKYSISENLRGYAWENTPVEPVNDVKISISDLNGFCSTRRNLFIKYVLKQKPQMNKYMLKGLAYHRLIRDTIFSIKKAIYSGINSGEEIVEEFFNSRIPERVCEKFKVELDECKKLYRFLLIQIAAKVDEVTSKYPNVDAENIVRLALPYFVERKVDGTAIGLSKYLSVDVFANKTVVDFKTGYEKREHAIALTGYALAIEADDEVDVDYGFLIYIRMGKNVSLKKRGFVISDELRREFLELRDEIAELIDSGIDPGKPEDCPIFCSYYNVCNESHS